MDEHLIAPQRRASHEIVARLDLVEDHLREIEGGCSHLVVSSDIDGMEREANA